MTIRVPHKKDVLEREHANFHEPLAVGAAVGHEPGVYGLGD